MSGAAGGPGATATPPRDPSQPRTPRHDDAVGASDRRHGRPVSPAVYRRRRLVALLGLLVVLALVVVLLAYVWPGFARSGAGTAGADPAPTVTVTAPAPTPTLDPVAREADTAFAKALPSTVLAFALTGEDAVGAWTDAGAIEAYALTYADAAGDDARTVTVTAGQYASAAEAQAAAGALVEAAGGADEEGDVTVDGETAGTYAVSAGDDGTSTVTWYNGTAVLQATGPTGVVEDVYSAYPL